MVRRRTYYSLGGASLFFMGRSVSPTLVRINGFNGVAPGFVGRPAVVRPLDGEGSRAPRCHLPGLRPGAHNVILIKALLSGPLLYEFQSSFCL